ncbi:MAG TPA: hypothetical protein VMM93_13370 [Vicinamibacterales bacterium]|nr:hypothetical protein [Vicinamibacterales bacterium]
MTGRSYRAGDALEDYCRACRIDRTHTVVAAGPEGQPIRVTCGYCRSEHNYRGGPRVGTSPPATGAAPSRPASPAAGTDDRARTPLDLVTVRERTHAPMTVPDATTDLELMLRRVIREEAGLSAVAPADKWRGGLLVLRPGTPGVQEKSWPIETFFHKIVMLRNRLRTLEQQVNGSDLPDDVKVKLQSYVTGCYGSLTSFNVLFADAEDQFTGAREE